MRSLHLTFGGVPSCPRPKSPPVIKRQEDFFSGPYTVVSPCTCNVPRAYAHHPSKFHRDLDTDHPRVTNREKETAELRGTSTAI